MPRFSALLVALSCAVLACAGCGSDAAKTSTASSTTTTSGSGSTTIPTPENTAPEADRVDLGTPTFSNPTEITNPYFPISKLDQVVLLGKEDGLPLRAETTRLPEPKVITWEGRDIETVVSQFVAYLDDELLEVATDYFAQDDEGNVWYLGEDVTNYESGVVANHDGTWLAGRDGSAGMIMPADPAVGDVFRPENIPGLVFEEVTVKGTGDTADGPTGPITGVLQNEELLADGDTELKRYAPGYGEFHTEHGTEILTVALGLPIDSTGTARPDSLEQLERGSADVFDSISSRDWTAASDLLGHLSQAWTTYQEDVPAPPLVGDHLDTALEALTTGIEEKDTAGSLLAASDARQSALDLSSRHDTPVPADISRLDRWARQAVADADAAALAKADAVMLEAIWARVRHTVSDDSTAAAVEAALGDMKTATETADPKEIAGAAAALITQVAVAERTY